MDRFSSGKARITGAAYGEKSLRRPPKGQVMVVLAVVIATLLGAVALATDVAIMYVNWARLQKGADSAVLAGANSLPAKPDEATAVAANYAALNGIDPSEITSTTVAPDNLSITLHAARTVPYFFARVLGLTDQLISVRATASVPFAPGTVGDNGGGTSGSTVGQFELIPIGLDHMTVFVDGQALTLHHQQVGPGNWDALALGGRGANNLRNNIKFGYSGPISIGDWVLTEPGKMVGPIDQGFSARIAAALSSDPSGTSANHDLRNPRVVVMSMVDWDHRNGRSEVQVQGFAALWVDGANGGNINVHFVSQVIQNSKPDPNAPFFGALGSPFLIE